MDITKSDRATLKSYFVKNAVPTAGHFADLIDGMINQKEDGIAKLPGEPLSLQAHGDDTSQKKAINFYRNFTDPNPAWTLSLNPRADPNNPATAKAGWSIGDAAGASRLFIDQATGNIGVGTVAPGGYKLNVSGSALFAGNYLYVNAETAGRLRVGAAWNMPGLYSGDDGAKPLVLGVPSGQKVYLGSGSGDAFVEGGTGNAYLKGNVGVGTAPSFAKLDVNGILKAAGSFNSGKDPDSGMSNGGNLVLKGNAPQIDFIDTDHNDWSIHVNGNKMYFIRQPWNYQDLVLDGTGNVGVGTDAPAGKLHVQTGGAGAWDKFVVKTTNFWGDGNTQYVTIGEGGAAGIMFYNPHVVWYAPESRASIRMGRSGGVSTGHWWDIGVRAGNLFSIVDGHNGAFGLSINEGGTVKVNVLQLGDKWRLSGVGDHEANDHWLRLKNAQNTTYYGGLAAYYLWSQGGAVQGSDLRYKRDIRPIEDATRRIMSIRGVAYKWKGEEQDDAQRLGLIAQEVEEVFPEAVSTGPDGMKGINYGALVAPLIETVKEQQARIDELRTEIRALKGA